MKSITRKFLVRKLPDLADIKPIQYHRFYLYSDKGIVIRVQKVGEKYQLERKVNESNLIRKGEVWEITAEEFASLVKKSEKSILRESYAISEEPKINLRVYHGEYEGLNRAEVSFESEEEAKNFVPLGWFNKEITDSPLAQDGTLLDLSKGEFKKLLDE